MTIKELKKLERGLLSSSRTSLINKGKAYAEVIKKFNAFSGDFLSDDALISDMALSYISEEQVHYKVTNKDEFLEHITAAKALVITDYFDKAYVKALLEPLGEKYTFAEAREFLSHTGNYKRISPATVRAIITEEGTEE